MSCSRAPEAVFLIFSFFSFLHFFASLVFFLQFYNENQSFSFFSSSDICSTIRTLDSSLVEGRHTSLVFAVNRTLPYSRANQDGVYWMYRLWVIFSFISSSSSLLFYFVIPSIPSFALPASEPGASDQMEFFHFIFPTLGTDIKFHRSRFCPCAVFHVHTRTFSSSLELSVKPNLHGLFWMFIPSELSREKMLTILPIK